MSSTGLKQQAILIKALGHPVRLHILDVLSRGEACVCHLTTLLRQRQPYISQQLTILRQAGMVRDRRDGSVIYYRLTDARISAVISLAREILRDRDALLEWPKIPSGPVVGCPCPHCAQHSEMRS